MTPAGDSKQHKTIFIDLSKVMGNPIKESAAEMKKAFQVNGKATLSAFEKKQGLDANPADIIESVNVNVTRNSRLAWLKEAMEATAK